MSGRAAATEEPKNDLEAFQTIKHKREAEREFHRARVAHLDQDISQWNRAINGRLPIMTLPSEILLSIFKLAVNFESPCSESNDPLEDHHHCHTALEFDTGCVCGRKAEYDISQVCHEWHALALGCS